MNPTGERTEMRANGGAGQFEWDEDILPWSLEDTMGKWLSNVQLCNLVNHVLPFNHCSTNAPLAAADYYFSVSVSGMWLHHHHESPSHCDFATIVTVNLHSLSLRLSLVQIITTCALYLGSGFQMRRHKSIVQNADGRQLGILKLKKKTICQQHMLSYSVPKGGKCEEML